MATKILQKEDIVTLGDIDIYRKQQVVNGQVKSRYQTIVDLYGQKQADIMMRNLEVKSW